MSYDVIIIGAGMAGASLAAEISGKVRVLLLEAEAQPGYHATGRSAAFWDETYGGPGVQPLTSASGDFLAHPPTDFSETGFLRPRGALIVGRSSDALRIDSMLADFADTDVVLERQDASAIAARLSGLREGWSEALWQPACADIDVAGLHGAYLSAARRGGVVVATNARVSDIARISTGWRVRWSGGEAQGETIVNAAGAWANNVARMAGVRTPGITPYRRTIAQLRTFPAVTEDLPLVIDVGGSFYFKPEAGGKLWLSPHDETPCPASDVAPEEIDVAIAIERLQSLVDWRVEAVERRWAGLRSFAPDRLPIYGYDMDAKGFFWCAGQGGFGIQTAPAAARLSAALLLAESPHLSLSRIDPAAYSPARFVIQ